MTSQEVASGPAKLGMLFAEEVNQLFQFWYASETLPENFITPRRHMTAQLHISRFGGKLNGWTYVAGRANGIKLCITSVTDKTNRSVDLASMRLVAVGVYLASEIPSVQTPLAVQSLPSNRPVYSHSAGGACPNNKVNNAYRNHCLCGQPYRHTSSYGQYCASSQDYYTCSCPPQTVTSTVQPSLPIPSPTISLKVYIEEGENQKELEEYRQTFCPSSGLTGEHVQKIVLSKAVPLKLQQRYFISADITGVQKSYYGTEGKGSVTKAISSGDFNVTVEFSEANGNQAPGTSNGQPSGITTVAQGQFPEFYFEVIG